MRQVNICNPALCEEPFGYNDVLIQAKDGYAVGGTFEVTNASFKIRLPSRGKTWMASDVEAIGLSIAKFVSLYDLIRNLSILLNNNHWLIVIDSQTFL